MGLEIEIVVLPNINAGMNLTFSRGLYSYIKREIVRDCTCIYKLNVEGRKST